MKKYEADTQRNIGGRIMIVDSMTDREVYSELEKDREAVTRWWHHQKEAMRR